MDQVMVNRWAPPPPLSAMRHPQHAKQCRLVSFEALSGAISLLLAVVQVIRVRVRLGVPLAVAVCEGGPHRGVLRQRRGVLAVGRLARVWFGAIRGVLRLACRNHSTIHVGGLGELVYVTYGRLRRQDDRGFVVVRLNTDCPCFC